MKMNSFVAALGCIGLAGNPGDISSQQSSSPQTQVGSINPGSHASSQSQLGRHIFWELTSAPGPFGTSDRIGAHDLITTLHQFGPRSYTPFTVKTIKDSVKSEVPGLRSRLSDLNNDNLPEFLEGYMAGLTDGCQSDPTGSDIVIIGPSEYPDSRCEDHQDSIGP